MFAVLIGIGAPSHYRNVEVNSLGASRDLLPLPYWMTHIWHHCLVPLRSLLPSALMDTRKFKSISINGTESSNGWGVGGGGGGRSFQEDELEYTFSLRGPDCSVSLDSHNRVLKWEVCGVITRESKKKSLLETEGKNKKRLRWICFILVHDLAFWFIFYWREECELGHWWH